jgi:hypothetical protein
MKTGDRGKITVEVLPQFVSGATAIEAIMSEALMKVGKAVVPDQVDGCDS